MPHSESPARAHGFTLVETVMVIAITGILSAVVARFIVAPVQGYLSTQARAALVDQADLALRRIGRDLRISLPNSARVTASGLALELVPTTGAARYVSEGSNRLQFGAVATSFDLVGPALTGSDVYADNTSAAAQANANRRSSTNGAGVASTITMNSAAGLPVAAFAPPYRVFAIESPVSYRCDLATGQLTRYQGYGFVATQPDPPATGSSAVLASGVTACRFSYDAAVLASRAALVTLALTLQTTTSSGTESVTLHHALHVDNLP
jgi:MSHA biogenesis protein MshO